MTDEILDQESGEASGAALPPVGSQLMAARERRGMSLEEAAQALKLGMRQVEALENGAWAGLPGPTFIRGFVRNYARLVQIDPAPLMAQLDAQIEPSRPSLDLPEATPAAIPMAGQSQRRDYAVALFGVALVVLALGLYFLLPSDLSEVRSRVESMVSLLSREEPAPAPAPQPEPLMPPGATPQEVLNPQAVPVPEAAPARPAPEAAAVPAPPVAAANVAAPTLRFAFDRESWVEVRDGDGKVIFSQRNAAGGEQAVDGKGPYSLVVGNAPGVRLFLRGQPVDLTPHTRGDVARLVLD